VLQTAGHFSAERLRDLHGEGAHASRGAVDQDLLPEHLIVSDHRFVDLPQF